MAENRLPPELDCSNLAKDWPTWKGTFCMYLHANGKLKEKEDVKIATFLWLVGPKAVEIYNTLFPNDGSTEQLLGIPASTSTGGEGARSLVNVLDAFDNYCIPKKNVAMESFKFNTLTQKDKQPFSEFETELRTQIRYCEYNCNCGQSYGDRMLRDRIILGVYDKTLQLKLLDGKDDPLAKIIEKCKVYEAANSHKMLLEQGNSKTINAIEESVHAITRFCYNCGQQFTTGHLNTCKAKEVTCRGCGKKGHFVKMCRGKKNQQLTDKKTTNNGQRANPGLSKQHGQVHSVGDQYNWNDEGKACNKTNISTSLVGNVHIYRINTSNNGTCKWTKKYYIQNTPISFKIDSGSDVNCIPVKYLSKFKTKFINKCNDYPLYDYSGNKIKTIGTVMLKCTDPDLNTEQEAEFVVVDNTSVPILGLETSVNFKIIKRMDINTIQSKMTPFPKSKSDFIKQYSTVFSGLGKFPGTVSITLKEGSTPCLHYKKRIPLSLLERFKCKIEEMVGNKVITPVNHPTDWVHNVQLVEKKNDIRVCLDPKPLNKCIKREHFLIPTFDDVTSQLANKCIFTVLDLSSGFWQMELDEPSSNLTTFMTPFGRYKFNRVPFGLNCAPEMFQKEMVKHFGDIPGVIIYFDDMAIVAETLEQHDEILATVLKRAIDKGIRFNPDKIQYRQTEMKFMGRVVSKGTIKPLDKYREAIIKLKKPENKSDVMRFLGMLKFLAAYIPHLSKQSTKLRELTHNNAKFQWTDAHEEEFQNLITIITSDPVLAIYDKEKPVVVQTDASKDGLGCVLLQEGHPVAYASRTLSKSEQKWAQIEKELLAIVFSCIKFHYYLYGREFLVQSDHKPLESLLRKEIDEVTPRLQAMFMFLLKYPKMEVVYTPGKQMLVADCLSRAPLGETAEIAELKGVIHTLSRKVCISKFNYDLYCKHMEQDEDYRKICQYVEQGWPSYHQLSELSKKFHKYKSEIHYENKMLLKNHRLIIPTALQPIVCRWLHRPHLGIEKTLAKARSLYFWPNMTEQIKELILGCVVCETFRRNNAKEPLRQDDVPEYPFQVIGIDIFEYAGRYYISLIDAYSNLVLSENLAHKTAGCVIDTLKKIFTKVGYPTTIRCDNNPFNSLEMENFFNDANIVVKFSSPRYPQSNGLAEKGVAIAKGLLKRCFEANEKDNFQYHILEYNNTPVADLQLAPTQLFFGRLIKTKLPTAELLLFRNSIDESEIGERIKKKRKKQKEYFDRNAKTLPELQLGDRIIFKKTDKKWYYGKIVQNINGRSYVIKDNNNNYFRRNRRFIVKSKNSVSDPEMLFEEGISHCNENLPLCTPRLERNDERESVAPSCSLNENRMPVTREAISNDETVTITENNSNTLERDEAMDAGTSSSQPYYQTRSGRLVIPPKLYGFHDD